MLWHMFDACPRMPMPAVTFRQSTAHSSQNCGVLMASSAVTFAVVTSSCSTVRGTKPSGFQPGGGTRTVIEPKTMKQKYTAPITRNASITPVECGVAKCRSSSLPNGAPMSAPPPKPMIAIPVAMPGRSGNHFTSVDTGEM